MFHKLVTTAKNWPQSTCFLSCLKGKIFQKNYYSMHSSAAAFTWLPVRKIFWTFMSMPHWLFCDCSCQHLGIDEQIPRKKIWRNNNGWLLKLHRCLVHAPGTWCWRNCAALRRMCNYQTNIGLGTQLIFLNAFYGEPFFMQKKSEATEQSPVYNNALFTAENHLMIKTLWTFSAWTFPAASMAAMKLLLVCWTDGSIHPVQTKYEGNIRKENLGN